MNANVECEKTFSFTCSTCLPEYQKNSDKGRIRKKKVTGGLQLLNCGVQLGRAQGKAPESHILW